MPELRRPITGARVLAVRDGRATEVPDHLVTEEPMEIRAAGPGQEPVSVAVTMRTPSHDFELAAGFLFAEGLVAPGDIAEIRYCELQEDDEQLYNVVTVRLRRPFDAEAVAHRAFLASASCGVCGKATLDDVERRCDPVPRGAPVARSMLLSLPDRLREKQRVFGQTGGLHAAADVTVGGTLLALREDVGRHNAVDKVVGRSFLAGDLPAADRVLMVSGRVGFEIVQKAAAAGFGVVAAVSAPSSLAVDLATRLGVTVAGFIRGDRLNIYSHPDRVALDA